MTLSAGTRLGPYQIVAPLGVGGMGEVYRALDPRLGREVAIKVLPEPVATDPERLRRFEQETRAVGALNHPHILTVHDVGTHNGTPYVVTELLEGETLREVLLRRTPTTRQVVAWGMQAAQGLSAAHRKGIVHRDVKPENLFLTSDGRIKILDFGLAKLTQVDEKAPRTQASTAAGGTEPGVVLGTVAYMSPEQVRAEGVDHRSDIFSLGVVLYELLCGENPFRRQTATATLTAILHETPLELSTLAAEISPAVERIIGRSLEKRREERFQSAHDLGLALEAVVAAPAGSAALLEVEERSPYPGLRSFTERDAGMFFGRESEVTALWERIRSRKLLAVIGPSGAGKTSFLRAGVIPARPEGWAAIVCTPGTTPMRGLGQALTPELTTDIQALQQLVSFEDPVTAFELLARWRRSRSEALVVVDQFEELFTLNPPETQARFAALLARVASEADVHVVLSLRDDFLIRCCEQAPLAPVLTQLTALLSLGRDALGRALVEPAKTLGYRFEDEALVEEMVESVEGARAALPLLAFAVSRLWERRDREKKLLTREAYREIGGVEGALAQHAEATYERIGSEREGIVREIFRNLTTAQGTRSVLDREELLSALPDRAAGEQVLQQLVDARLLTSYETEGGEGEPSRHRVEIVHESLLKAWPRLVRWQTQDADGAQLRDQLRQAAHLWEERGKTEDLLWTGASFLDFRAWRERYPGGLSSVEEDFAKSMASVADRKRRRKRAAVGSIVAALLVVACVMAVLWSRSETQRTRAQAASRRAEASKLLALAQLEVDADPTAALAYVTKSLELEDTQTARFFALRVVQNAPVASELAGGASHPGFSPNGEWLAMLQAGKIRLLNQDGREPVTISPGELAPGTFMGLGFGPDSKVLSLGFRDALRLLSVPDGREVGQVKYRESVDNWCDCGTAAVKDDGNRRTFFRRPWDGGEQQLIGTLESPVPVWASNRPFTAMAYAVGRKLYLKSADRWASAPRLLGEHPTDVTWVSLSDNGQRLAAAEKSGEIRIWDTTSTSGRPLRVLPAPTVMAPVGRNTAWYGTARWIMSDTSDEGHAFLRLWDLTDPPGAGPLVLRTKASNLSWWGVDPLERGCTAVNDDGGHLLFWPLPRSRPRVLDWREGLIGSVAFTADGATLVAATYEGDLRAWPLSAEAPRAFRTFPKTSDFPARMAAAPTRREIVVASAKGRVQVIPVDGGKPRELEGLPKKRVAAVAFSPDGRRVCAAPFGGPAGEKRIHVWDLESGTVQVLEPVPKADDQREGGFSRLSFVDNDRIVATVNGNGLMLFDLRDGKAKVLSSVINSELAVGRNGRVGVGLAYDEKSPSWEILRFALDGSPPVPLPYRAEGGGALALDPSETLVASTGADGVVRVGPISGGEPQILFGHKGEVDSLAFSPDGKWLASGGFDQTVRLWPVPDVKQVPPHKRSHEEFLATLRTFTNVRAVPDAKSPNGWKLQPGPFPGWQTPPHW